MTVSLTDAQALLAGVQEKFPDQKVRLSLDATGRIRIICENDDHWFGVVLDMHHLEIPGSIAELVGVVCGSLLNCTIVPIDTTLGEVPRPSVWDRLQE